MREGLLYRKKSMSMYGDEQILFLRDSLTEALDVFKLGLILRKNNIVLDSFRETFEFSLEQLNFEIEKRGL